MHRLASWFRNLKVSQKLMLITVFFVMPDSMMFYFFIDSMNANIRFAELEKQGNAYQRPLEALLELIPEHRVLAGQAALGATAPGGEIQAMQARIDAAFTALEAVDARIGADLQFTDEGLAKRNRGQFRAAILRADWTSLRDQLPSLDADTRIARHRQLVAGIRTMITHSGDNSNLILDPDLDSYYVMDATLLALPATQERLAEVMEQARAIFERPAIPAIERQQLAVQAALLQESDLDRIKGSLQTALNEDQNFHETSTTLQTRLPPALEEYSAAAAAVIALTRRLANEETSGITAAEYGAAGQRARAASFRLWTVAAEELDALLQKRIDVFQTQRAKSLVVACLALLAAVGFVSFITRSISVPLRKQTELLQAANERFQDEIAERRAAEEALRITEAKFRGIVEQLPAITYHAALGQTCEWSYVSPQILPLLGFTQEEWLASTQLWFEQIHPDDRAIPIEAEATGVRTGRMSADYRIFTRAGEMRWFRDQRILVPAEAGKLMIYGVMMDITKAKAAEAELAELHRQLLDTSRRAGMADVASSVLHNVGNVLNSVNISTSQIATALRGSAVGDVGRVAGLLAGHEADLAVYLTADPKGRQIPSFLGRLASALTEERAANLAEVETLASNVDHLKQIIAMQQGIARAGGVWEPVTLPELFEQALAINLASIGRHGIEIIREFADLPPVVTDRHQVLQVLVNLISNAKYAMLAADNPVKCLTLRAQAHAARPDFYLMEVSDTGTGIAPEHLPRIFTQGFTTKQEGHGFGLHSCALAAQALGGVLTVRSAGPGCGATFTLRLPAHDRTLAAAA